MKKILLSLFACAALISSASAAAVTFTFQTTANATGQGYTSGATYNFSFTTGASYPTLSTLSTSTFSSTNNYWRNTSAADTGTLFVSSGGTGLLGSFVPSTTTPNSYIFQNSLSGGSDFQVSNGGTQNSGMTTLGGTPLSYVFGGNMNYTLSPAGGYPNTYNDPTTFYTARPGVYAVTAGSNPGPATLTLYGLSNNNLAAFTVNQLTISAIPEPSTYAAIAGAAMLGLAVWQRRRKSTQATLSTGSVAA